MFAAGRRKLHAGRVRYPKKERPGRVRAVIKIKAITRGCVLGL
jgi:hypothetical protein